jgi:hypothetical protein
VSDPISPGDLCIVVRDCCGKYVGAPVVVEAIITQRIMCGHCRWIPAEMIQFVIVRSERDVEVVV